MLLVELLYKAKKSFIQFYKKYFTTEGTYTCILPDKLYLKMLYKQRTGKTLNLKKPQNYSEKGNWLKLYNRQKEYTVMADKYEVKRYISDILGEEYVVPIIGTWDSPDDIDFSSLPNEFVLKCNHDNGVIICRDKYKLDIAKTKEELKQRLNRNYYKKLREWPYKNIQRKIICEKYMYPPINEDPLDYKMFCFNGKVKIIAVCTNRYNGCAMEDYYTVDWKHIDAFKKPQRGDVYNPPPCLNEMMVLAEKLSENIPFLRVDFNVWKNNFTVGELTFFNYGCMLPFNEPWETKLGEWIELPKKHRR